MVVKVKEPQPAEYQQLREDQVLFTYLHLAPDEAQTQGPDGVRLPSPSPTRPSPTRAAACRCWRR